VMAFDDSVDLAHVVHRIAAFFRDESCGQCVPCRVGTVRQEEALHRLASASDASDRAREVALINEIARAMRDASICGLGQTAASAVESALTLRLLSDTGTSA
jgi:NADH-quinone oxidoreductase subunit F